MYPGNEIRTSIRRREALQELLQRLQERYVVFSEGVVGAGRAFFAAVVLPPEPEWKDPCACPTLCVLFGSLT